MLKPVFCYWSFCNNILLNYFIYNYLTAIICFAKLHPTKATKYSIQLK